MERAPVSSEARMERAPVSSEARMERAPVSHPHTPGVRR